ncbi:hypothetical protein [Brachybacterium sacelli]|uniref:hypothetical protein n=1 Tax=Brachybacterium sacelli TaxID=173364 RepID=UPI00361299BF
MVTPSQDVNGRYRWCVRCAVPTYWKRCGPADGCLSCRPAQGLGLGIAERPPGRFGVELPP